MKDLFGDQAPSNQASSKDQQEVFRTEKLLKNIAWMMAPVSFDIIAQMTANYRMSRKASKEMIEKLIGEKKLIHRADCPLFWNGEGYYIPPMLHLDLLWEIKDESETLYKSLEGYFRSYGWKGDGTLGLKWRKALFECAASDTVPAFPPLDVAGVAYRLCSSMSYHPHWAGCFSRLPHTVLTRYFQEQSTLWMKFLIDPPMDFIQENYLDNPRLSDSYKMAVREALAFLTYVLPGRIREIPKEITNQTIDGVCAHALYMQYLNDWKGAVSVYQNCLKDYGLLLFHNPFYNMAYAVALARVGSEGAKKKMNALLKKKEIIDAKYLPMRFVLMEALHLPVDSLLDYLLRVYPLMPFLEQVLAVLVLRRYHLSECSFASMGTIQKTLSKDSLKLLQWEFSPVIPAFQENEAALQEALDVDSMFPTRARTEEWERTLERLMDLVGNAPAKAGKADKAVATSRITYLIGRGDSITPRLQKSKDGVTWSNGRDIALSTFKQQSMPEMGDVDRRVAAYLHAYASNGWGRPEYYEFDKPEAFAALAGHPLVFLENTPGVPVVIKKEDPQVVVTKTKEGFQVSSNLKGQGHASVVLRKENDQLYRVMEVSSKQWEILDTLHRNPNFPKSAQEQLSKVLGYLGQKLMVHSDLLQEDKSLKSIKGDSLITVQLLPMGDGIKVELFVKPFVDQPPYCKAGAGAASVIGLVKDERVQAVRDMKKEKANLQLVGDLLREVSSDPTVTDVAFFDDYYQCLELIEHLREIPKVARVEWPEGVKFTVNRSADFDQLRLSLKGAGQWFEVDGELVVDDKCKIKISELLEKVRQSKGRFVELTDSDFLALSNQLRKRLAELDNLLYAQKNKLQISRLNMPLLGEMEQAGIVLKKDQTCMELQKRIDEADQELFVVPKMLQAELRGYQLDGFRWMSRLAHWGAGACLADDMGLGKTVQAIALMMSRARQGASLVVAPASVLLNWKAEINRFAPSLNAVVMHANGDRQQLLEQASGFDVVLTTYGLLITESEALADKEWNIIVLDEAHTIKNKETKMAKAAMKLKADFRLLLTGTPIQNHLGEIWTLFQFANPGLLGSFQQFTDRFILPIEKEGDKLRQKQLKKILLPFLLRRTKAEVLDELPEKTEITLSVELSGEERALYEHIREQALLNLEEGSSLPMQTLAEITRLRQAACHPALVNAQLNLASSKTEAFLRLVDELMDSRHRALVFSQFTSHLALIRKALDERKIDYLYLDGAVLVNERTELVKKFQTGEQPLFLISLKAGGTGLNLTAADYVIHLDPWWNPAVEDQASDRAHRIGQTRPVTIYRLIATQTIEEKIIKLHQTKKSLADSLLDGSDMAHKLSKEEMLELLREAN